MTTFSHLSKCICQHCCVLLPERIGLPVFDNALMMMMTMEKMGEEEKMRERTNERTNGGEEKRDDVKK
jgi:hypothetical protein